MHRRGVADRLQQHDQASRRAHQIRVRLELQQRSVDVEERARGRRPRALPTRSRWPGLHGFMMAARLSSRHRFVIGSRRSRPKALNEIFGPGGYCAALVLRAVGQLRSPFRPARSRNRRRPVRRTAVLLDVVVEDVVEQIVRRQRVGVELAGRSSADGGLAIAVRRDRRLLAAFLGVRVAPIASRQTKVFGTSLSGAYPPTASP